MQYSITPGQQQQQQGTVLGMMQPPGTTVQQAYRGGGFPVERYKGRQSLGLGIALIVVGLISVCCNIADISIGSDLEQSNRRSYSESYYWSYYTSLFTTCTSSGCVGHGFWGGIMAIITGALGVVAGRGRNRCAITAFLILAIFSMAVCGVVLIIAACGASVSAYKARDYDCIGGSYGQSISEKSCQELRALAAMEALIAIASGITWIASMWGSILCCMGNDCCSQQVTTFAYVTPGTQMTVTTMTQQQQQQQPYGQPYGLQYVQPMQPMVYQPGPAYGYPQQSQPGAGFVVAPPPYNASDSAAATAPLPPAYQGQMPQASLGYSAPQEQQIKY